MLDNSSLANSVIVSQYELFMVVQLCLSILILKLCIWRCDGPERHEKVTVINAYYGYMEYCKFVTFCTNLALI